VTRPLLDVEGVSKTFTSGGLFQPRRAVVAVQQVSLSIARGETLGLVGESGCGKSTLARLIMRLVEPTAGRVLFDGVEVTAQSGAALRATRRRMQMVFQDPYASLNPRMRIRRVLAEPLRAHGVARDTWRECMDDALARVGLPIGHLDRFAHELSGGQRQRVGIARALILKPDLVLLDEPVAALDVSIQAQVLNLMKALQAELGLTFLFIAHDLAVVRQISHRVGVMLLGHLVETADRDALYTSPRHPYTRMLLAAAPSLKRRERRRSVSVAAGELPDPSERVTGCPFQSRCPLVRSLCRTQMPELREVSPGHRVACHAVDSGVTERQPRTELMK
jgi:oligopeptide transport system ATP-binding protein